MTRYYQRWCEVGTGAPLPWNGPPAEVADWGRPADWLALPAVVAGNDKFVGLYAVFNTDSNWCTLNFNGDYTVDWGDGSAPENVVGGVTAEHSYDYADLAGSECSRGYRQAVITVIPQGASDTTHIDLAQPHSSSTGIYSTQWLDIKWTNANCDEFLLGDITEAIFHGMLEQFETVGVNAISSFEAFFYNCFSLQSVPTLYTSAGTSFYATFVGCRSLKTVPFIDTALGTNFMGMFNACRSLRTIPMLDTSSGTTFNSMFSECSSIESIPLLDTSGATGDSMQGMFYECAALQTVPFVDTSGNTNFCDFVSYCYSLQIIPLFDTSSGADFNGMFALCRSLEEIPLINTALGTDFSDMFTGCSALRTIPLLDTSSGTDFQNMFQDCVNLQTIPLLNIESGISFNQMFQNCTNLQTIPFLAPYGAGFFTFMFQSCVSLQKATMDQPQRDITFENCKLSQVELVDIFNNLYDFTEDMYIDVSPTTAWAADDVITGQTSGTTCVIVSKTSDTLYVVKSRDGVFGGGGEVIGVTGNADKLADQGAGYPGFFEILEIDVSPATDWAAADTITGQDSGETCVVVSKTSDTEYVVKDRTGDFNEEEEIGVTGVPLKLATQGEGYPAFSGDRGYREISIIGCWGTPDLTAPDIAIAETRGWEVITA